SWQERPFDSVTTKTGKGPRPLFRFRTITTTEERAMFDEADLIHRYSRADALRDGGLVDVSETAREADIRYPVALTRAAWEQCVAIPPGVVCQDEAGRLGAVLWML